MGSENPITYVSVGAGEIEVNLRKVEAELADLHTPLQEAAVAISKKTTEYFASSGEGSWDAPAADTIRRRMGDKSAPPLQDFGAMLRAVTATEEGVPFSLYSLVNNTLTIGVSRADINAHIYGNRVMRKDGTEGGEPARPFLLYDVDAMEEELLMMAAFDNYLHEIFQWAQG